MPKSSPISRDISIRGIPFTIKPIKRLFAIVRGKKELIICINGSIKSIGRIIPLKKSIGTTRRSEVKIAVD